MYDPDIHHRHSIRLPDFDYSSNGAYFITICASQRQCLFGEVKDGTMTSSEAGEILCRVWHGLAERFVSVETLDHVVMPNHFHGILLLHGMGAACCAPASCAPAFSAPTLGDVVRAFKSISGISINRVLGRQGIPLWQRNYYEHIIRNEADLINVRRYIAENSLRWAHDKINPENP